MEIVIDIPEFAYIAIKKYGLENCKPMLIHNTSYAIKVGTPLPKHGRLIDADALVDSLGASDRDIYCKAVIEEDAPTIIEGSENE